MDSRYLPGSFRSLNDGDAVIKLSVKREFSVIPGFVRKWTDRLGRHSLADREDAEMCTPMCAQIIDVLACGKQPALGLEKPVMIYSVPTHDIDENIHALKEAIKYLEWLKIGG